MNGAIFFIQCTLCCSEKQIILLKPFLPQRYSIGSLCCLDYPDMVTFLGKRFGVLGQCPLLHKGVEYNRFNSDRDLVETHPYMTVKTTHIFNVNEKYSENLFKRNNWKYLNQSI